METYESATIRAQDWLKALADQELMLSPFVELSAFEFGIIGPIERDREEHGLRSLLRRSRAKWMNENPD